MALSGDESGRPELRQDVAPHGDAYVAGRDIIVQAPPPAPAPPGRVWGGVPARNPAFTGREDLLRAVRDALVAGDRTVVQALHGMGGVGKTQIAIEYAHRFAAEYEIVWWLNAENAALLGEQFGALGAELGCAAPGMPLPAMRQAVLGGLRQRGSWLLVFDNAEDPEAVADWLPGGSGHVLITSRSPAWRQVAIPVDVSPLPRAESVTLLRDWVRGLPEPEAGWVADAVGDLPLALAQAAGFMAETGMPAAEYVSLLRDRAAEILDLGRPPSYPLSLAAVTEIAYDLLRGHYAGAADLVAVCAFLAPDPVPADWFTVAAAELPESLREPAADRLAWREVLARLGRSSLIRVDPNGLVAHRLTQAIVRGHLSAEQAVASRVMADSVITANEPADPALPGSWPAWARILPHLLALDPATEASDGLRHVAANATWYLICRGDAQAAHDLSAQLHERWRDLLGPDHDSALGVANSLAQSLHGLGRYAEARDLNEDLLARFRRLRGDDDPRTLTAASNLAVALRMVKEYRAARVLNEETLARRRRVLGDDDPATLSSASNLAIDVRELGDYHAARVLNEETLARRRRVLGDDHPATLSSANNLAIDLRLLGEPQAARELNEDTLARRRRLLGEDHPDTLACASNLANDIRDAGEYQAARELDEDTLARRRRVLGDEHPDTLASADQLASDLHRLGEHRAARELYEETLARRHRVLGDDHPDTLMSSRNLAVSLRALGESRAARELDEHALAQYRRVLGEDHPLTLECAENLAWDFRALFDYPAARELDEDTLARRRRVLGDEHPATLISANNLGVDLFVLHEYQAARELNEDTLARRRRLVGDDHPDTLVSASNLAVDLRALGEHQAARELNEDTLARRRRVLGDDHPDTQRTARNLAADLRLLGESGADPAS